MRPLFCSLVLILLLPGCSDPGAPEDPAPLAPLYGTWEHLRTCGGSSPMCFDGGGQVEFIRPDSMIGRSSAGDVVMAYRARLRDDVSTPYGTYPSLDVYVDDLAEWRPLYTVLHLTADSLELGDNAADGFSLEFARLSN